MNEESYLKLLNHFSRAHPWHGVEIGEKAPEEVQCFIEILPTDTIKYELEKSSGLLRIDRPQKYSNNCPSLYGLIPQTYAGKRVGAYCCEKTGRSGILGDDDPLDVCVLTEKPILRSDILVTAVPIGGIRAIDGNEADDKIIAVLEGDLVYHKIRDISQCPDNLIDRLIHYFLTYKESPSDLRGQERRLEIDGVYDAAEARKIIQLAQQDYDEKFPNMRATLKKMLH